MSEELDVFLDFLFQMWAIQFPTAFGINIILYLLFLLTNTNTLVDFGWAFNQMVFALSIMLQDHKHFTLKYGFMTIAVFIWFFRLGGFIFFTRIINSTNDSRYEEMSAGGSDTKRKLMFLFQFLFQALFVILPASPLFFMFRKPDHYGWNFYTGLSIALIGIMLEGIADQQLYRWVMQKSKARRQKSKAKIDLEETQKGSIIEIQNHTVEDSNTFRGGLWKKSRHPNLFYEFVVWVGFAITGINDVISLIGLAGPFTLLLIMYFVTIPITERSMKAKRPNWSKYEKETNRISPIF